MKLRRYQSEARDAILKSWEEDRKVLLILPTGCGKTIVFASVTNDLVGEGHRVLILAHREELLDQASDKLKRAYGLDTVLEKAESSCMGSNVPIVVGSVQSLAQDKRLAQFPPNYFDEIIVDEAHHSLSDSYQKVLEHFDAKVLGVTATPDRGDKKNLAKYFDKIAYEYKLTTAIKEGYLSPVKAQMIPLDIDLSQVGISNGDYAVGEIGSALDPYLERIADEMVKYQDRKTVVFLPLIATSQKFCEMLKKRGFRAAEVNGNSTDRAEILSDFEQGHYNILCSSMLLTEGWDCPSVDCIVVLRPTKVRSLYQQMVGRGMRLSPETGKKDLLLLDFLWMTGRHDLCRPSALVAKDDDTKDRIDKMVEDGEEIDIMEAEETAAKDAIAERENALRKQLEDQRHKRAKLVDPLQYAFSIYDEDLADYVPTFAWEMAPPTTKQVDMLEKRGINPDAIQNAGQASMIIDKLIHRQQEGLATPKQIRCLERFGFQKVGTWQFEDASKMIGRLSKNKWRIPNGVNPYTYKPKASNMEIYLNGF